MTDDDTIDRDDSIGRDDSIPDFVAARDHVLGELVRFTRTLRAAGAAVPANAALDGARALVEVGLGDRTRVRAALHAALISDQHGSEIFEEEFPTFWYRLRTGIEAMAAVDDGDDGTHGAGEYGGDDGLNLPGETASNGDAHGDGSGDDQETTVTARTTRPDPHGTDDGERPVDDDEPAAAQYSAVGEADEIEATGFGSGASDVREPHVRRFETALSNLRGRRWDAGDGRRLDARRALRESLGTGGTAVSLPHRDRKPGAFRTCLLVDVSQSVLDTIDREFLLSFARRLQRQSRRGRTFFFDTDIREVTDVFADAGPGTDPMAALRRAEVAWGGGTQIGDALTTLRERYPSAVDRQTVVIVVSDGLDVGEMAVLDRGMVWLSRRAAGVLWLNPLAATRGYEPTCRGMATALPYVDGLFAFAESTDLVEIARQLEQRGFDGPLGYQYDPRLDPGRSASERRSAVRTTTGGGKS